MPFIAIGLISYNTASTSLSEQAMNQLTSIREMKKTELEKYFANRTADIKTLATSTMTLNALMAYKEAFKEIGAEKARKLYIFDNPHPPGKKGELMDAHDGSLYSAFHAKYHPLLKNYLKEYVYFYDLFLVDSETGDVVYTVFKEDDYGTNLYNGKYSKTNIGELARAVNASQDNTIKRVDFQFYEPSNGDPTRFMASPILNEEGKRAGILILQFSIETIDNIMMVRAGLGETGEAYLVGPDKLMRSNSRFSKESTVLKQKVDTAAVQEALNNQAGTKVIKDYRGVSVISAYSPIKVGEMTWAIIAEIGEAEALKAAISLRNRMLIIGVGIATGVVGLGYLATRRVTNLLKGLISELAESSSCVSSASQQTSASSQSLSEGTTEQAAAVEETSASMEEMSSMTKQNADNAREASQLAVLCNKSAEEGNQSMFEMNSAMNEIDQSGKKIGEIIRTIDGIAFQTNLLALNAAVEAARAGEHGKGLAVVAEEVRNLAQRSAVAAKDTSSLIQESLRKTNGGTELAKKCTESFQNIVTNVKKMASLVNEISAASQEQSQGVAQVSKAIQQIDQALQANAANAEEAASAGEELASQSHILNNLISRIANEVGSNGRVRSQESGVKDSRLQTSDSRLQPYLHNRINKQLFEEDEVPYSASKRGDNGGKG